MRAVVQRVKEAKVLVDGRVTGKIDKGLLIFLGVSREDGETDLAFLTSKIPDLRIFADASEKFNLSLKDVGGEILVVSQFTLYADYRKGRRPSFTQAADPLLAKDLYERFILQLKAQGIPVQTGEFQATMEVHLINDGPVTLILESRKD